MHMHETPDDMLAPVGCSIDNLHGIVEQTQSKQTTIRTDRNSRDWCTNTRQETFFIGRQVPYDKHRFFTTRDHMRAIREHSNAMNNMSMPMTIGPNRSTHLLPKLNIKPPAQHSSNTTNLAPCQFMPLPCTSQNTNPSCCC